jgi:hypothetical protein
LAEPTPNSDPGPVDVHRLAHVAGRLIASALAPASREAYRRALLKFARFNYACLSRTTIFPVDVHSLLLYAAHLFDCSYAPSSIQSSLLAICYCNNLVSGCNLAKCFLVKKLLAGIHRESPPRLLRAPIALDILHALLDFTASAASGCSAYDKLLFSAMFLLAFHAFLRVGEFTTRSASSHAETLQRSDISFPGTSGVLVTLHYFKGNTSRTPFQILIPPSSVSSHCPVTAIRLFTIARGAAPGPLFVHSDGSPVLRAQFSVHLARSLDALGLSQANLRPHSFRIGAATSACAEGVSDSVIQRLGRWKSDTYKRYIRIPCFTSP